MRIVIHTQYYTPETGAPQNRLSDLARRLKDMGHDVKVLTAMPNYPEMEVHRSYRGRGALQEEVDGIPVLRSWLWVTRKRSVIPRLLTYFSFVCSSLWLGLLRLEQQDVLICESPPLFLGITGWLLSRAKGARFVFNVSDLWPESAEQMGIVTGGLFLKMAYALEAFLYRRAALVTAQTRGICASIDRRFPDVSTFWFPNGADPDELAVAESYPSWRTRLKIPDDSLVIVYGGIIGHAQGLDIILRAAEEGRESNIVFLIAGDGPERISLEHATQLKELDHVHFVGHLEQEEMRSLIDASDVALVPLRKLDLFKGAIPSKLFESLALGKPLLLGVDGEARELFIDRAGAGYFYEPEDAVDLMVKIRLLKEDPDERRAMGARGRAYVLEHFNRERLARELATRLSGLPPCRGSTDRQLRRNGGRGHGRD